MIMTENMKILKSTYSKLIREVYPEKEVQEALIEKVFSGEYAVLFLLLAEIEMRKVKEFERMWNDNFT